MANVKKGQTVRAPEWWKHLKWTKRAFWKRQRAVDRREWVDPDDGPELTEEMAERADLYHGDQLIQPGKGGPNLRVAEAIRRTRG